MNNLQNRYKINSRQSNKVFKGYKMINYSTFLPSPLGLLPWREMKGALMQPGDVPRTEADVTDLVKNLGYKPDTPVKKGIERFIEWYRDYFNAK
jgi:nucleoside-diphosphate-sugar epimerase